MANHATHIPRGQKRPEAPVTDSARLDPQLVALVKFLARRTAERDYEGLQNCDSQADRQFGGAKDSK